MSSRPVDARSALLKSAEAAFARKGYAATSVVDILGVTGLSKPTLYYYFGSKTGIFRAILAFAYDETFRLMQEATAPPSKSAEKLLRLINVVFDFANHHRDLTRLVFATVFAAAEEIPQDSIDPARRRRNFEYVLSLIRDGQKLGEFDRRWDPVDLTHGIFGAMTHRIRAHLFESSGTLDADLARRVVDLFLNGATSPVPRSQTRP